jgi:LysM repeat protein
MKYFLDICKYKFCTMKKLFFLLFLLPLFAAAQKIITHTVGPKESLTSIGRLYNINGRELANYNKIDYTKGLTLGQVLKIPAQNAPAKAAEPATVKAAAVIKTEAPAKVVSTSNKNGSPIYHTVAKQETLYHISTLYNKVPIADIKKWNNLTSDALSEGVKIIVGYSSDKGAAEAKKTPVVTGTVKEEVIEAPKPKKEDSPRIKTAGEEEINAKAREEKKEMPQPVKKEVITIAVKAAEFNGGIFKNIFDEQISGRQLINEKGAGGVFKSTSGWQDGRYYCLHNIAAAGTIVKITNNATGKSVYAKVLDMIPDIKQNTGLLIRLSNAAADALGANADSKLDCTLNYSK